jgi:hypothetical protein
MNRRRSRESLTGTILTDSTAGRTAGAYSPELKPRRNRDYNPQLLPMSEITTSTSGIFFLCNIVFIFIQVNLVNDKPK